ncbi:MAG: hypothetical protein JW737_03540 [Acidobacteria bacterium]|nr:hypothetical protein [Acidobacteriota bacterium]
MKKLLLLILTCFTAVLASGLASTLPANVSLEYDSGSVYIDDDYRLDIIIKPSSSGIDAPRFITYQPPEGRTVKRIERFDRINAIPGQDSKTGNVKFSIYLHVSSLSDKTQGTLKMFLTPESGEGDSIPVEYKIDDIHSKGKILNRFKTNQLILLLLVIAVIIFLAFYVIFRIKHKKAAVQDYGRQREDMFRMELNSIGRLLDKNEYNLFVNQAKAFMDKVISEFNESGNTEESLGSDRLFFIEDPEFKRKVQQADKALYDARFSGAIPTQDMLELIYEVCNTLNEMRLKK